MNKKGKPSSQSWVHAVSYQTTVGSLVETLSKKFKNDVRLWVKPARDDDEENEKSEQKSGQRSDSVEKSKTEKSKTESQYVSEWVLFPSNEYPSQLDNFRRQFVSGMEVMVEVKQENQWIKMPENQKKDWRNFEINDEIDAQDAQGKWYESTVRMVKEGKVCIHFNGWASNWDEWVPVDSERLAPKNTHTTGPFIPSSWQGLQRAHSMGKPPSRGAVGLKNLGNTCFMNSVLQCLVNTPVLSDYFINNTHTRELNKTNPLGWNGRVAEEYGRLVQEMWCGKYKSVAPVGLKKVLGEFQPRFSGYQQQDSSELLSFLLDGLHEDLNRVKSKPPTEVVESNGRPDMVVAEEAWLRHLKRNQSVIVDLCQGQLKSRVVCPDCKKESITFDPFMFLSVPVPTAVEFPQDLTVFDSPAAPQLIAVRVSKQTSVRELKALAAVTVGKKWNLDAMLVAEVQDGRIHRVCRDSERAAFSPKDQIWVYHLQDLMGGGPQSYTVALTHSLASPRENKFIVYPSIVCIPGESFNKMAVRTLRALVKAAATPYLQGGWRDGEYEEDLYDLVALDASRKATLVPHNMSTIDLAKYLQKGSYFCCRWKERAQSRLVTDKVAAHISHTQRTRLLKKNTDLDDCLNAFAKEEVLAASEAWYCGSCKKHQCASKKMDLWKLPDVLVIHLKRFSYNSVYRDKIDTFVQYPTTDELDLRRWVVNEEERKRSVYQLYAVSNHRGSLSGGHYTAYSRNTADGRWYLLDDSRVTPVEDMKDVLTPEAYVLFYHRKRLNPDLAAGAERP